MNLLKGSWVLKILALLFAFLTYFYIHNEIESAARKAPDPSYKLIKLTAKNLPVKVRLATIPPEGYRIVDDQVTPVPAQVIVIGPEALLEEASNAETALIDVSEFTRTMSRKIPLESVAGIHLTDNAYLVDVMVPIEKVPAEPEIAPQP
ncbi:MAG: hypothetical protein A3C47_03110 [Omnitrophica bacterium RIFCSPHIGHO2_02_FULL_51_18]|nr:MAG: hypothetical protein A3C47_03110 [Omnitrophica bacterium RIFCSPHIGHO2_02_FULL_51_18]